MPNGNNNKFWMWIVGGLVLALVGMIGLVWATTTGDIDHNAQDIKTLSVKTDSTDKTAIRLEERMIYIQGDIAEIKDELKAIRAKLEQ